VAQFVELPLAWTRGAAEVELRFEALHVDDADSKATMVLCRFDSLAGRAALPKSVMSVLAPGDELTLYTVRLRRIDHGDFSTTLAAVTDVSTPDERFMAKLKVE